MAGGSGGSSSSSSSGPELALPRERGVGRATLCNLFATLGAEVVAVVAVDGVEAGVVVGAGRRRRHPGRGRRPAANATSRCIAKPTGPWG